LKCRNFKRNLINCVNCDDSMLNQQSLSKDKIKQKQTDQSIESQTKIQIQIQIQKYK
jgi:hypothetical protein